MTHIVTGCAGFIGYHLCRALLDAHCFVVGIDNLCESYDPVLKQRRVNLLQLDQKFTFEQSCILDQEIESAFSRSKITAVFHLAARAGIPQSFREPDAYYRTNLWGTYQILKWAQQYQASRFVLASSSSVYPPTEIRSVEWTDCCPRSPYGGSKLAAELIARLHSHTIPVAVLRFFTCYGPWGRPDMSLFRFVQRIAEGKIITIYGDGKQQRDFTYVSDLVAGLQASLKLSSNFQILNLGAGHPVSLLQAIEIIEGLTGNKADIEYRSPRRGDRDLNWASTEKASDLLGWAPEVSLQQGLARLWTWYQENRSWAKDLNTEA